MVLIHSTVLKDDSKDLPYTSYTALAAVRGTDGDISVHCFTVSKELTFTDHCLEGNTIFQVSFTMPT